MQLERHTMGDKAYTWARQQNLKC